jgi:hypothetical protein
MLLEPSSKTETAVVYAVLSAFPTNTATSHTQSAEDCGRYSRVSQRNSGFSKVF